MTTFKSFEEIQCWQKARELTREIYNCSSTGSFAKEFGLRDQIHKAAISTCSNIAPGFERGGTAQFIRFLSISKGSAGEVKAQLYLALDQEYISSEEFHKIFSLANETSRTIAGSMTHLRKTRIREKKYKLSMFVLDRELETRN